MTCFPVTIEGAFQTRIEDTASSVPTNLEGEFRRALGGEDLFDTSTAVQSGATGQGVTNLRGSLFDAITDQRKQGGTGRGLGTQGVF